MRLISVVLMLYLMCSGALAHDADIEISRWMGTLMRPDIYGPCCGQSDAYPVRVLEEGGWGGEGKDWTVQVIDGSAHALSDGSMREGIKDGTIIKVPAAKVIQPEKNTNPTRYAWIFMSVYADSTSIFCFVPLLPGV